MIAMIAIVAAALAQIDWKATFEEARKVAADQRPIVVFVSQKSCAQSAELLKNLSKDDRLPEVAREFAWLAIVVGTPEYKKWFLKCGASIEGTPALVFLNPKGDAADPAYASLPVVTSSDADEAFAALRQVLVRAKKDIGAAEKKRVEELVAKAKEAPTPGEAIAAYRGVLRSADGWASQAAAVAEAREAVQGLLQRGCAELVKVQETSRDAKAASKAYAELRVAYAGTVVAELALEEMKRVR